MNEHFGTPNAHASISFCCDVLMLEYQTLRRNEITTYELGSLEKESLIFNNFVMVGMWPFSFVGYFLDFNNLFCKICSMQSTKYEA